MLLFVRRIGEIYRVEISGYCDFKVKLTIGDRFVIVGSLSDNQFVRRRSTLNERKESIRAQVVNAGNCTKHLLALHYVAYL